MDRDVLKKLLQRVRRGETGVDEALEKLGSSPVVASPPVAIRIEEV